MILSLVKTFISSFFATLGFGVLFNVNKKDLFWASFTGAVGGLFYKLCILYGYGEYISNFVGAVALSICAELLARKFKNPVTTYVVCALIPLVPGGLLYTMMVQAMRGSTVSAMSTLFMTLAIAGTLAVGVLIVSTFFKLHSDFKKGVS